MTPCKNKPLIYGPDGKPLVRVNDRLAPKPRIGAGLEGWVSWGLIDRKGRVVKGGEQHNLILDGFLDKLATVQMLPITLLLSHFAVGTSSTPPDVTDVALGSEVSGRATTLITDTALRTSDGEYETVVEREFDFGQGNGNLTEFGFAQGASGDMLVRELFRDAQGDPITITKTPDYKLRIKYTLTVTLSPVTATVGSFVISGVGTVAGKYMWLGGDSGDARTIYGGLDYRAFARTATGTVYPRVSPMAPAMSYPTRPSVGGHLGTRTPSAYTPGSYTRSIEAHWSTAVGNDVVASISAMGDNYNNQTYPGFIFVIDEDDRFTKDSLHTLTIYDLLTVSWARG